VSDFITIFSCFKFQDLIFDIIKSILEEDIDFLLAINSLYSNAFTLAFSISETT
jgi:hypothetical protein